jgi:Integrase
MPKIVKGLSAIEVKRLSHAISKSGKPYNALHAVGGVPGLKLQCCPTGARSWVLRTVVGAVRKDIGLGSYPSVGLAEARIKAQVAKDLIVQGIDPTAERKAARQRLIAQQQSTLLFKEAAERYITSRTTAWKNPRQADQWRASLRDYAYPHIGTLPVSQIGLTQVKAVLDPIWEIKTETASRVRSRIENILGWCALHGYRDTSNPAKWAGFLSQIYPSPERIKRKKHFAALPFPELPSFMAELRKRSGMAARALEFMILTAARTNEVIGDKRIGKTGVHWEDVDLVKAIWTVPAEKMKEGKTHRVPLSPDAVRLLQKMERVPGAQIFHSDGDIPSNNFLTSLIQKRMGIAVTAHGFRSTFKDWCRECTTFPDEASELALAHVNSDETRAAYARSQLIEIRRQLMADWADFCRSCK